MSGGPLWMRSFHAVAADQTWEETDPGVDFAPEVFCMYGTGRESHQCKPGCYCSEEFHNCTKQSMCMPVVEMECCRLVNGARFQTPEMQVITQRLLVLVQCLLEFLPGLMGS